MAKNPLRSLNSDSLLNIIVDQNLIPNCISGIPRSNSNPWLNIVSNSYKHVLIVTSLGTKIFLIIQLFHRCHVWGKVNFEYIFYIYMKFGLVSLWWACAVVTEWLLTQSKFVLWFLMLSTMHNSIHKSCLKVSGVDFFKLLTSFSYVGLWPATVNLVWAHLQSDDAPCSAMLMFYLD